MKSVPKAVLRLLTIGAAFLALALVTPADAATFTLTDQNSSAQINDASQSGMFNWTVNGVNQLAQQWFWYRNGSSGGQSSIDSLSLLGATATDTNGNGLNDTLVLRYGNDPTATLFEIDVKYTLRGTASSGSDITEQITIDNNSTTSSLNFHFFQYTNFDLNGTSAGDTVTLAQSNVVDQSKSGGPLISETVATPFPSHYELGLTTDSPNTLTRLNTVSGLTLSDGPTTRGPGDATWAFEWDPTIAAQSSFVINKDKNLSVPEPGTSALIISVGTAFAGMTFLRKRRRRWYSYYERF